MTLLWKIIANPVIRNPRNLYFDVPFKCHFNLCQGLSVRVFKRLSVFTNLRHQTTHANKSKILNSKAKLAERIPRTSELRRLLSLAAPEKWRIICGIVFLIISSTVTMAVPFCLGKIIDIIYTTDKEKMKENLKHLSFILFGVFAIGAICNCCRIYLMSTAGYRTTQSLRKKAYAAIISQETAMFDQHSTGELVGRLTGDTQVVSSAITNSISDGLRSSIMTIVGMSMMFYVSPELAIVGLSVIPVVGGVAVIYGRIIKSLSRDVQNALAVLNTNAEEKISNIRTVKAFAQETREIEVYSKKIQNMLQLCYRESLYRGMFFGFTGFSGNTIILSVLYYGGVMISDATITVGNLSAFLLYAAYVSISINGLSSFYNDINKALGANTRLFQILERQPRIPFKGGKILDKELVGDIVFRDVCFAYPTRNQSLILKNFNLNLPERSITAIVGPSGCGKSTVASLLLRLYDPESGQILLDNHDLRELDPIWVKSQIGLVSQEPTLFSGTIRENIMYGKEDATEREVEEVAQQAKVLHFIRDMKDGLNTVVGERGITLSGGQKQRVAIARALIKNPKILILDEATSALDAESENFIRETFAKAAKGRTVLTIAHRLSTIKNADKIVVMDQGRVVESGTYNDLMTKKDGHFRRLMQHQTFA